MPCSLCFFFLFTNHLCFSSLSALAQGINIPSTSVTNSDPGLPVRSAAKHILTIPVSIKGLLRFSPMKRDEPSLNHLKHSYQNPRHPYPTSANVSYLSSRRSSTHPPQTIVSNKHVELQCFCTRCSEKRRREVMSETWDEIFTLVLHKRAKLDLGFEKRASKLRLGPSREPVHSYSSAALFEIRDPFRLQCQM